MRRVLLTLFALALATAGIYAAYAHDLTAARARLVGRSKTLPTSFGAMEYALVGQGKPLLMVHGAEGGFDQSLDMAGELAGQGYELIAPSRFGYLRSTAPAEPTTAMQADAYVELLDRLGVDQVIVVGISAGAWSSLQFAIRHPERCRALVLLGPADYLPVGTAIHGGAMVSAMIKSDFLAWTVFHLMPDWRGRMAGTMLGTDPAVLRAADPNEKVRVQQILEHLLPVSQRLVGMNFDIKTAATYEPYPLEKISCPVLAIEDDRFGTAARAKYIAAHVSGAKVILFPTGGHALVGHYADALRDVTAFLKTL
jgi:pimeloyl-ACP methyl ester carboxylesterase